nr:tRNA (uracil-5-)-methyltransferase homolog A-like [Onthophagus taurus]
MSNEKAEENVPNKDGDNPYAYLERDFSSESFKIEVKNLPKYYGINEFRKLLNEKLKLASNKIKSPRQNCSYIFVCFRNEEDRQNAINTITNYKWKGKVLNAIKAKPAPDPLVKKRKDTEENSPNKKIKSDKPLLERLKDSTIPFWNITYNQQLEEKQKTIRDILIKFGNNLSHQNNSLQKWIEKQKLKHNGLPCELLQIRSVDKIEGYRNKCEFSVGINEETNEKTVGFRMGSYANGITSVGPIQDLCHIPETMKLAVKYYEDFVKSYDLEVFNPEKQTGHFRQLSIRSAPEQLMLVFGIHPQDLNAEKVAKFKEDVVEFFTTGLGGGCGVTSMYYQEITKR